MASGRPGSTSILRRNRVTPEHPARRGTTLGRVAAEDAPKGARRVQYSKIAPFVYYPPCFLVLLREVPMLAEIFMLRLEVKARDGKEAAATTSSRFVPVTLPVVKAS